MRRSFNLNYRGLVKSFSVILFLLTVGTLGNAVHAQQLNQKANSADKKQVRYGQLVYKRFCSLCHGANLEGQPNWNKRRSDGKYPAPPHDKTGHTWHHPDDVLFGTVKLGMVPPYAPDNYKSDMPAWGSTLKDRDIWAVIAYIKSRWPDDIRKIQAEINRDSQ